MELFGMSVQVEQGEQPMEIERDLRTGYVVTTEMYDDLYNAYYTLCSHERLPCIAIIKRGNLSRVDLDMTSAAAILSDLGKQALVELASNSSTPDMHIDNVYFWLTRVSNRKSGLIARAISNIVMTSEHKICV